MADNYVPIACATNERLEFAVLRGHRLRLTWLGEDGQPQFRELMQPLDLETRDGAY